MKTQQTLGPYVVYCDMTAITQDELHNIMRIVDDNHSNACQVDINYDCLNQTFRVDLYNHLKDCYDSFRV